MIAETNNDIYAQLVNEIKKDLWRGGYAEILAEAKKKTPITASEVKHTFNNRAVHPFKRLIILEAASALIRKRKAEEEKLVKNLNIR